MMQMLLNSTNRKEKLVTGDTPLSRRKAPYKAHDSMSFVSVGSQVLVQRKALAALGAKEGAATARRGGWRRLGALTGCCGRRTGKPAIVGSLAPAAQVLHTRPTGLFDTPLPPARGIKDAIR